MKVSITDVPYLYRCGCSFQHYVAIQSFGAKRATEGPQENRGVFRYKYGVFRDAGSRRPRTRPKLDAIAMLLILEAHRIRL